VQSSQHCDTRDCRDKHWHITNLPPTMTFCRQLFSLHKLPSPTVRSQPICIWPTKIYSLELLKTPEQLTWLATQHNAAVSDTCSLIWSSWQTRQRDRRDTCPGSTSHPPHVSSHRQEQSAGRWINDQSWCPPTETGASDDLNTHITRATRTTHQNLFKAWH